MTHGPEAVTAMKSMAKVIGTPKTVAQRSGIDRSPIGVGGVPDPSSFTRRLFIMPHKYAVLGHVSEPGETGIATLRSDKISRVQLSEKNP
jgi:hypothetical protein